jgi:hypothetical protein
VLNWLQEAEDQLDSMGVVPAEIEAIDKQLNEVKVPD